MCFYANKQIIFSLPRPAKIWSKVDRCPTRYRAVKLRYALASAAGAPASTAANAPMRAAWQDTSPNKWAKRRLMRRNFAGLCYNAGSLRPITNLSALAEIDGETHALRT